MARAEVCAPRGRSCLLALGLSCAVVACGGDDEFDRAGSGTPYAIQPWSVPPVGKPFDMPPLRGPAGAGGIGGAPAVVTPPPPTMDAGIDEDDAGAPDFELQRFDSQQVYLFANLAPSLGGGPVIAPVLALEDGIVGFDSSTQAIQIQPTNRYLLYAIAPTHIRVFRCDECLLGPPDERPYPANPAANDGWISPPPCSEMESLSPIRFLVGLDGRIIHSEDGLTWCDAAGSRVAVGPRQVPVSVGTADTVLRRDGIWLQKTNELVPFTGLPEDDRILCARALADGYWIALGNGAWAAQVELWHVKLDGTASRVGVYPDAPADLEARFEVALDGDGQLYQFVADLDHTYDAILRRSLSGESEVVYDERRDVRVTIDSSAELVTGP